MDISDIYDKRAIRDRKDASVRNDAIKQRAGEEMVVLLQNWKRKLRRYRIYRSLLCLGLAASFVALTGMLYYQVDSSVPSVINVRAGEEESFRLGIPARGEIISVSDQGTSNIDRKSVV